LPLFTKRIPKTSDITQNNHYKIKNVHDKCSTMGCMRFVLEMEEVEVDDVILALVQAANNHEQLLKYYTNEFLADVE
jgi:hypothetical protein